MANEQMHTPTLILATASPYKRALMHRLGLAFSAQSPDIDETPHTNEHADKLAQRLALSKALEVSKSRPDAWVIGCDQSVDLEGQILGKPGSLARAKQQLQACSGKQAHFHTAVALNGPNIKACKLSTTSVLFRTLSEKQIDNYLQREPALDCAGSFKAESLGIALFDRIDSDDPTSLIGLPLISLRHLLSTAGIEVLS